VEYVVLQEYLNVKYAMTCANGTDALHISLLALGVKKDYEIMTVSHTWISTSETISLCLAIPMNFF
jgi:UDP-2-acetamido-2-deoxy-ribo-hexuluronate aminotransferase